jgi:2-polyprenyl-6-methoxyphenol hydroxylase-like FAD-dependent oxidoreductase
MKPEVVVAGAGPAGLVAAITLGRYGIPTLLVDKRTELSTLSRATVISTRCMEIFRSWGLEDAVRAGAADVEPCGWVTPALASGEGSVIQLGYPTIAEAATVSPSGPAWAPQDHLEPVLLGGLEQTEVGRLRVGCEVVGLEQHADGVVVSILEARTGATEHVDARYLVGADGAHSTVRTALEIEMAGPAALAEFQMVQFDAPFARMLGERRYGLNIVTHPEAPGVFVVRGRHDRWGYAREVRDGQERLDDCSEQRLAELIATASGVAVSPRIERVSTFRFAAQIADRYRDGRCFLAGDAAHRMTPRGGTGMNTAIQDAYDLAWKLAWVLHGWAQPELLDSYEGERRPVGLHNVTRSADPNGAQNQADDALSWDLDGRLRHRWLGANGATRSTLDLLGDGLTLLAGPDGGGSRPASRLDPAIPLAAHTLDPAAASALDIPPGGALLLRPDGKEVLRSPTPDGPRPLPSWLAAA